MVAKGPKTAVPSVAPKIHEATLASGPSGAVLKGREIDLAGAVARRKGGLDIVVCGNERGANQALARRVEAAVGPYQQEPPHADAGPNALPHFQPKSRPPAGHSFYETENPRRKARKRS